MGRDVRLSEKLVFEYRHGSDGRIVKLTLHERMTSFCKHIKAPINDVAFIEMEKIVRMLYMCVSYLALPRQDGGFLQNLRCSRHLRQEKYIPDQRGGKG